MNFKQFNKVQENTAFVTCHTELHVVYIKRCVEKAVQRSSLQTLLNVNTK